MASHWNTNNLNAHVCLANKILQTSSIHVSKRLQSKTTHRHQRSSNQHGGPTWPSSTKIELKSNSRKFNSIILCFTHWEVHLLFYLAPWRSAFLTTRVWKRSTCSGWRCKLVSPVNEQRTGCSLGHVPERSNWDYRNMVGIHEKCRNVPRWRWRFDVLSFSRIVKGRDGRDQINMNHRVQIFACPDSTMILQMCVLILACCCRLFAWFLLLPILTQ